MATRQRKVLPLEEGLDIFNEKFSEIGGRLITFLDTGLFYKEGFIFVSPNFIFHQVISIFDPFSLRNVRGKDFKIICYIYGSNCSDS